LLLGIFTVPAKAFSFSLSGLMSIIAQLKEYAAQRDGHLPNRPFTYA
jgi:hypothetical protein